MTVSEQKREPKEFSHIEIKVIRNPEWLKQFEKEGYFLSEVFPLENYDLPPHLKTITEGELDRLKRWLHSFFDRHANRIENDD